MEQQVNERLQFITVTESNLNLFDLHSAFWFKRINVMCVSVFSYSYLSEDRFEFCGHRSEDILACPIWQTFKEVLEG